MIRSLRQVFRTNDRMLGTASRTGGSEKLITNPYNPRERRVVAGYIEDYTWQNAVKSRSNSLPALVDTNSNWRRKGNFVVEKKDVTATAVPEVDPVKDMVREI